MKKEKYELYKENFKSIIDNEYHEEIYYTTNKKLYEKKTMFDKASDRYDMLQACIIVFFIALFIFTTIALALWFEYKDLVGSLIVFIIDLGWVLGLLISGFLYLKNKTIYNLTYSWREEFISNREYKRQTKAYKNIYRQNAYRKKHEAATKLTNIWQVLDSRFNPGEKIISLATLLDIQDTEKILNKDKN